MYNNPKKIILILLVIFGSLQRILAQTEKDSLQYYLSLIDAKKTEYPVDSISNYYQKARALSAPFEKIHLLRREAKMLVDKGFRKESLDLLNQALAQAKAHHFRTVEALIYQGYAYYYYNFNDFLSSYKNLLLSKSLIEELSRIEIDSFNKKSTYSFTKDEMLQTVLYNIGTIALTNEEYQKAEKYFKDALIYSLKNNDKQGVLDARINLASLANDKKEYSAAIFRFKKLLNENRLDKFDRSLAYFNIALAYSDLDSLDLATVNVDKAIALSEEIEDRVSLVDLTFLKSQIEGKRGNYEKEMELLSGKLKDIVEMEDFETQVEYYNALAKSEENRGHYKKATYWFKKQSQLQDSIVEKIYQNKFKNIEIENEFLLQQQKNKFQKEIISNQKAKAKLYFLIIVLLGILVITLFMLWYFAIRHHFKRLKIEVQKRKIHQIEEENKRKVEALETQQIQAELKSKKRELLISLLFVKKRKEKVKQIYEEIEKVADRSIISKESVLQIKDFVKLKSDELDQAEDVQHKLVNTHKDFFNKLLKDFPELSKTELKILAYLSIGLSTKEIADVQYVSIEAIRKSRYRIRKKLNLEAKDSLENFILQYH